MTRVGYVLKVFPRLSQTFVINELRAHERAGCRPPIFALRPPRPEDRDLVRPPLAAEVILLPGPDEPVVERLVAEIRLRGLEHLHAHFGNVAARVARAAAQAAGITYSFTAHAKDIFEETVDRAELAAKLADAATVVTVSRFNVDYLWAAYGVRAMLVRNGLPLDDFPWTPPERRAPRLVAVGRLIAKKGFADLIDAIARLRATGVAIPLDIIGDGPERDALAARIAAHELAGQVTLLGALPPTAVRGRMAAAGALVAPCVVAASGDRDGLPTVLLEAMALGTPCVGTAVTGSPEVLQDGETGLLLPPGDIEGLASACRRILVDEGLRARVSANARRLITTDYDSDRTARRLRSLWRRRRPTVVFRIFNRKGIGHWMRARNIAGEILHQAPETDVRFLLRSALPALPVDPRITCHLAPDPERMAGLAGLPEDVRPDLVVDDTLLPAAPLEDPTRSAFIMRRCSAARQAGILADPALRRQSLILVPHTPEEFGAPLPMDLVDRVIHVGPIVRAPDPAARARLEADYDLSPDDFVFVSTPGGGGFTEDGVRFLRLVTATHRRLVATLPRLRHLVFTGPLSTLTFEPVDDRMRVAAAEPELVTLLTRADAVLSAGGYNSVHEIRLTRRPVFFAPGERKHDDQEQRVRALERLGLAVVVDAHDPEGAARRIAAACLDGKSLARMTRNHDALDFRPGNAAAARHLLDVLWS